MTYLMWRLHNHLIEAIVYATMVVPLLLGLFWGAPLLARQFEEVRMASRGPKASRDAAGCTAI